MSTTCCSSRSQPASLDVLSGGRLLLGTGAGWVREELANHRPGLPFKHRYSALAERIQALRSCWGDEPSEFSGTWDRFTASHVYPKPQQAPLPVGFGGSGPIGISLTIQHADEWLPIDVGLQRRQGGVAAAVEQFRHKAAAAGRGDIPITLFVWGWEEGNPSLELLRSYSALGLRGLVILPASMARHDATVSLRRLDEFQPFVDGLR